MQLNSRLRVAHITQGLDVGGQERLLLEMARHANHERFAWTVIVIGNRGSLAGAMEATGARVIALDLPMALHPGLWRRLARLLRAEKFDVVHTHDDGPLVYGLPAAWWAGVPRRLHTHHHGRLPWISGRQSLLVRLAARFSHHFLCVSQDSARYMIEQGVPAKRVHTLWNGIDLARFAYQGPCENGSVVTVARLSPEKDIGTLLRAARQVVNASAEVRFEIAGNGPCREELDRLRAELNLANHVHFLGEVRDVPALLARARMFVLPSLSEGISLTLLEAMARGLPLVTTRVGGNPEVVHDGVTGLLVPAGDPGALAQAILQILGDRAGAEGMGRAGRQRVEKWFDLRKMMAAYEALYVGDESGIHSSQGLHA